MLGHLPTEDEEMQQEQEEMLKIKSGTPEEKEREESGLNQQLTLMEAYRYAREGPVLSSFIAMGMNIFYY